MLKIRTSLAAATVATALATLSSAQTRVQILHASDLEGGVNAIADAPNFAAVVEALEARAASGSTPSLLLSAGDNYIPGPFFSAAGARSLRDVFRAVLNNPDAREGDGRVDISIMNLLGFDASAVGNHEFDNGADTFQSIIGTDIRSGTEARWLGAQFPYLSANLDFSGEPALAGLFTSTIQPSTSFQSLLSSLGTAAAAPKLAPAATIVRGSETFGVVGGTTPLLESITSSGGVQVQNPGAGTNDMAALASILQPTVDQLIGMGVDKIILVTHLQQFALEQALTPLLRGVDVVISGGSDTLLADPDDRLRAGEVATGPYPVITQNADGEPALIVSTAGQYGYVGRLVVSFDAQGIVDPSSIVQAESGAYATDDQGVIALAGSMASAFAPGTDAESVKTLTDAVSQIVQQRDGNIVGKASVFLEGRRTPVRTEETNFGNLTADANLAAAQSFDPTVLVSHKNGGGIRNPIGSINGTTGALGPTLANPAAGKQAGDVSQLDIENTLRFNNGLTLFTLTREQLKQVIEHAVAATGPGNTPGQFGQFGGLSFSFDVSRAAGDRVRYAALTSRSANEPVLIENGTVTGNDRVRIVTLDFLANGGDNYPFPAFEAANPTFANRVDLSAAGLPAGTATFAPAGTEQDALAEYMLANFSSTPFADADDPVADDQRIQQIGTRPGLSVTRRGGWFRRFVTFDVSGAPARHFAVLAIADRAGLSAFSFGPFGSYEMGVAAARPFFIGRTNRNGQVSARLRTPFFWRGRLVAQVATLGFGFGSLDAATTESVAFRAGR